MDDDEELSGEMDGRQGWAGSVVVVPARARRVRAKDEPAALWEMMIGRPYPMRGLGDLPGIRARLAGRWPHAIQVIDDILNDAAQRSAAGGGVTIGPTLLVGSPGTGKTSLALELGTALGLAPQVVGCGGVNDSMFGGSNRRWSNSDVCFPVNAIGKTGVANVMLVLDELEKVSSGRTNGSLLDTLLGMLDPITSQAWHDPCVEEGVDLRAINWLCTANDASVLPAPLRDRLRLVRFPEPGGEHLPALAQSVLQDIAQQRGLRPQWIAPLSADELDAVAEIWHPRSMRALRRLVEGVIEARDQHQRARALH